MTSKWLIITMLLGILTACRNSDAREVNDKSIVHKAMKTAADEVEKIYGFSFSGISEEGDKSNDKYKVIGLFFSAQRYISKKEARKIIIDVTKIILSKLNDDEVSPFLTVNPFTEKNLETTIYVKVPTRDWDYSQLSFFGNREGNIFFSYAIPNEKYKTRNEKETFEETFKMVEKETKPE